MDENGNILIKRIAKTNVYVKITTGGEDNAVSNDILKMPNGALEAERPMKLFDMKKFQQVRYLLISRRHHSEIAVPFLEFQIWTPNTNIPNTGITVYWGAGAIAEKGVLAPLSEIAPADTSGPISGASLLFRESYH